MSSALSRYFGRWQALYASALGLIGALILFFEKVDSFVTGKPLLYLLVVFFAFRYEAFLLVVVLGTAPFFVRTVKSAIASAASLWRMRRHRALPPRRLIHLALVALLLLGTFGVTGYMYARDKRRFLLHLPTHLMNISTDALREGATGRARLVLRAGATVLADPSCERELETLNDRMAMAQELEAWYKMMKFGSPARARVRVSMLTLTCDEWSYEQRVNEEKEHFGRLRSEYGNAIEDVFNGSPHAVEKLQKVQDDAPGFGDVHRLLAELRDRPPRTPYLDALRRLGVVRFVTAVCAPFAVDDTALLKEVEREK